LKKHQLIESEKKMFSNMLNIKKPNQREFQVLFLSNDSSQKVEVHEVSDVDFLTVQERLELGESVFITSKQSQKLKSPKKENRASRIVKTRLATIIRFDR
jgi:hypothetical protein